MAEVPKDGGWAYFVLIGCFINTFFVIGGMKSIGVLFVQVVEYFDASPALAGWMIGLQYFGLSVFSPIVTAVGAKYNYRIVVFLGGTIMALGFLLAAFIRNVYAVITILGLFIGIGNGFLFTPSLIMVGQYFDRYRSTAMGVVMAGGGVGQLAIPVLMQFLLDELSFYGCCLIYAAITLNTAVAAMLLRPQSFYLSRGKARGVELERQAAPPCQQKCNGECECKESAGDVTNDTRQANDVRKETEATKEKTVTDADRKCNSSHDGPDVDVNCTREGFENKKGDAELSESIPLANETSSPDAKAKKPICGHICHPFSSMFDPAVTGRFVFWIYNSAVCLANAGYLCQFFMLPSYGKELGVSKQEVAWILAISGLVDLVARIIGGVFNNMRITTTGIFVSVSLFITGATVSICLALPCFGSLLAHSVLLGFFGGMYIALYPVALVEFLGIDLFPKAFALIVMSMGFVILPLPNLFGKLYAVVGSYLPTMWICVVAMVIGGILVAFEPLAQKLDDKRSNSHVTSGTAQEETV